MKVEEATRSDLSCLIAMKHVCKFCHKRFPCGRSLGGHMRSHLITNPSDHETPPKDKIKKKKKKNLTSPPTAADAAFAAGDPNPIKCCKECGKGFHSSKALSGHMKSHAVEREKEKQREKESSLLDDDDDQIESEKSPKQQVMDRESDNEAAAGAAIGCRRPRRSKRRQRFTNGGSSSVPEIDQQEQEDVAMCLIMLSRDVGPWGELSDNNSVFNWVGKGNGYPESNSDVSIPDRFLSNLGKIQSVLVQPDFVSSAMSEMETSKRKAQFEALELEESDKRSKFECTTCNKAFHSYQALGGHRASHKKANGGSPSKGDSDEIAAVLAPKRGGQVAQKHECPICFKEFPSGQALGGHKRSHLMAASSLEAAKFVSTVVEKSNTTTLTATTTTTTTATSSHEVRDFLDLNLPAPVEEEASNGPHRHQQQLDLVGFKPWWVGSTHKHEQLVGLI